MRNTNAGQVSGSGDVNHLFPWKQSILAYVDQPNVIVAGSWNTTQFTDTLCQNVNNGWGAWTGAGAAQNDEWGWNLPLSAGTWTFAFYIRKSTNTGIITVLLDGSSVGTLDTYNASATGARLSLTGVVVPFTGVHSFHVKAATKNASSSGYAIEFLAINLFRTA